MVAVACSVGLARLHTFLMRLTLCALEDSIHSFETVKGSDEHRLLSLFRTYHLRSFS